MLTSGPNSLKKDQFQSANNDELIKTEIKRETSWEDRNYYESIESQKFDNSNTVTKKPDLIPKGNISP